ncbi:unnamed protein product [Calypogeia fissa]
MKSRAKKQKESIQSGSSSNPSELGTSDDSDDDEVQELSDDTSNNNDNNESMDEADQKKSSKKPSTSNLGSKCKKQRKKTTADKGPQQIVDNDHVSTLVREYRKHFKEYSKGRKRKAKQLIPNKVWLKV